MTMEILLVNDDGIYSNGLLALKNVICEEFDANVTVVAPLISRVVLEEQ